MATQLINKSKAGSVVANNLMFANSFLSKALGLMGRRPLAQGQALYFKGSKLVPCNSIHTCFMRFPLDVVFLDKDQKVKAITLGLKPWRMTWPVRGAMDVVEMTSGSLTSLNIEIGDQFHVGD